jgi:hypothetical protein
MGTLNPAYQVIATLEWATTRAERGIVRAKRE